MTTEFISLTCILHHLTPQDDPEAWKAILGVIGEEFAEQYRASVHGKQSWFLRIGACSHWWRPHQARWTQAGGFAWPAGYSGSRWPGPPELDSSVILSFDGEHWKRAEKFSGNKHVALRVTVPTRTAKHKQAAVHTVWSKSHEPIFYGFRNIDGRWICVAASDEHKEGQIIDVLYGPRSHTRIIATMLLTITTTHQPATDLGYLLHKNPTKVHSFELSFGKAHLFYPEATAERCSAALLLDVDPVGLVRKQGQHGGGTLDQYVNDRPYVLSSFLSVAMGRTLGTAMTGRSKGRQELADQAIPLIAKLAVVCSRGGEELIRELFEPLGYTVTTEHHPLDEKFPEWGQGPYYVVKLEASIRLKDLLNHLYVLVPVLDAEKHYWIGKDEVEKLLRKGHGWLSSHPHKEAIVKRYLPRQRQLAREALARLTEEDSPDPDAVDEAHSEEEMKVEEPIRLWQQRMGAVVAVLRSAGAKRVLDLGCGEGRLLGALLEEKSLTQIVGMDVSYRSLEIASQRLRLDRMPATQKERLKLIHGSLMYRDKRLEGYDAATVVEVIEHLDPPRLAAFERVLFESARPKTVIVTTPNAEYNVKFDTLPAGQFRHKDHRFEWTREEFQNWSGRMAERFGYHVRFLPVGEEDSQVGAPTQMGVFDRA